MRGGRQGRHEEGGNGKGYQGQAAHWVFSMISRIVPGYTRAARPSLKTGGDR
jgi:hypothetical protein